MAATKMVEIAGVLSAVNALTVTDDARKAYLLDPRVDAIISISLSDGSRVVYKWYDKEYHHRRWVCYCLFSVKKETTGDFLPMLFFNQTRKTFHLIIFQLDHHRKLMHKTSEHLLKIDPVQTDSFCYAAHKDANKVEIIFYSRWQTSEEHQAFALVVLDCRTMRVSTKHGSLPTGQWELPFIADNLLHFISSEKAPTTMASWSLETSPDTKAAWDVTAVEPDENHGHPLKKGAWCNAWRNDNAWFLVTERMTAEDKDNQRRTSLWLLDIGERRWVKLPIDIETPERTSNFAFRVTPTGASFVHADWDRTAASFHRFELRSYTRKAIHAAAGRISTESFNSDITQLSRKQSDAPQQEEEDVGLPLATAAIASWADHVICPICLDTYDDPRTLSCGHSLCAACIEGMRGQAKAPRVQCPSCRRNTTIPANGLPPNFSLIDAIEKLEMSRSASSDSCRRCDLCRKQCDELEMWKCLSCLNHEKQDGESEYCALCLLKFHGDHEKMQLHDFIDQETVVHALIREMRAKTQGRIEALRIELHDEIERMVVEPLQRLCDTRFTQVQRNCLDPQETSGSTADIYELVDDICHQTADTFANGFQKALRKVSANSTPEKELVKISANGATEQGRAHCSKTFV